MALEITAQTVPHNDQRHGGVGDWFMEADATWSVLVSEMGDWRMEFLVAIHEMIEMALCMHNGVSSGMVDDFDSNFKGEGEPGDDPNAPYKKQHCVATGVERILATMLDVEWTAYENTIRKL